MRLRLLALLVVVTGSAAADIFSDGYCNGMKISPSDHQNYNVKKKNEYDMELKFYVSCEMILGDFYILSDALTVFNLLQEITGFLYIGKGVTKNIIMPRLVVVHGETLYEGKYSVVFDGYMGQYFNAPSFTLIRQGSLLVRNTPKLCNVKSSIEKKTLLRLSPKEVSNDRYVIENSFTDQQCSVRRKCIRCVNYCWASNTDNEEIEGVAGILPCQNRPFNVADCNCPKKDPITQRPACFLQNSQPKCCDESCDGACVLLPSLDPTQPSNMLRCVSCARGKSLDSKTGKCIDHCPTKQLGSVCRSKVFCPEHFVNFNEHCYTECPLGMTVKLVDKQYFCVGCPVTLNGDRLISTCGRVCNVKVTPTDGRLTSSNVIKLWPHFGVFKYSEIQVNEAMMCDVLIGDITVDALGVAYSHLWFLSRLRSVHGKINRINASPGPVLFFSNTHYIKEIDLSNFENSYIDIAEAFYKVEYVVIIKKEYCGTCPATCFIPNHCYSCENKREIVDARSGLLSTYCSKEPLAAHEFIDTSMVLNSAYQEVPRNLILPCHSSCKPQTENTRWCTGQTSFDCVECKITLKAYNMVTCVEQCPLGYYQKDKTCLRCHATCRKGCSGPDATMGPSGCNHCLSFVSPPSDFLPKEPLCFKPSSDVSNRIAQLFEKARS